MDEVVEGKFNDEGGYEVSIIPYPTSRLEESETVGLALSLPWSDLVGRSPTFAYWRKVGLRPTRSDHNSYFTFGEKVS